MKADVWPMSAAGDLLLDRSPRLFEYETALEQGGCWRRWSGASA
jgi:hypothetical protein